MKKLLSISLSLMLCLTAVVFFGCEPKAKPVSEVEASNILTTAMANMETENALKIHSSNFMFMGEFVTIASETESYTNFMGVESWTKQESGNWYAYSKTITEIADTPEIIYTKQLIPTENGEVDEDNLSMIWEMLEESEFEEASLLKDVYSISFEVEEDGDEATITFKVQDETLKAIEISAGKYTMSIEFEFGASVLEDMPEIPTNVDWIEYEPYIKVVGMQTQFVVGDTLNISDIDLEFYDDISNTSFPVEFDLTLDMITGFTTETAGTRTMRITFCGLTFDVEYTVTEAVE